VIVPVIGINNLADVIIMQIVTIVTRTLEIHVRSLIQKSSNLAIFLWTELPKIPPDAGSDMGFSKNLSGHYLRYSLCMFIFFSVQARLLAPKDIKF